MCSPTVCQTCKKIAFSGCGKHLDNIFNGKKATDLCQCNPVIVNYIKNKNL
jgi:hypothetical protein